METPRFPSSIWRRTGLVIAALILGFSLALVFTHATILIPLLIVLVLGPMGIIHYLLWGWWVSPRNAREGEWNNSAFDRVGISPLVNSEAIVSKEQKIGYYSDNCSNQNK